MKDSKNFWNHLDTKKLNKLSTMISISYKTANKVLTMNFLNISARIILNNSPLFHMFCGDKCYEMNDSS